MEWAGALKPELEASYFELQDALMKASSFESLNKLMPLEYASLPVNLVTGFADGDISYHMLAPLFDIPSGNQVIDGTIVKQD